MKVLLALAGFASLTLAWLFWGANQSGLEQIAARSPRSATAVVAVSNPGSIIHETNNLIDSLSDIDENFKSEVNSFQRELRLFLETDGLDPDSLESDFGIDLSETLGLVVLEIDDDLEAKGVLFDAEIEKPKSLSYGLSRISDKQDFYFNKEVVKNEIELEISNGPVGMAGSIVNQRLSALFSDQTEDRILDLRNFKDEAKRRPLSEMRQFQKTVSSLPRKGDVRAFVNLQSIIDRLPTEEMPPLVLDFAGLGVEVGANQVSLALLLAQNSKLRDYMQTGSSCQEFLAKSDKPALVACVSLHQPFEIARYIEEQNGPTGSRFDDDELERIFGLNYRELCDLFADGAAGFMLFPGGKGRPRIMTFVKTNDREKAFAMARMLGQGDEEVRFGENMIRTSGYECWGVVDGYLVGGTAEKQILNLARGEGSGWNPSCGGKQLASAELFAGDFIETLSELMPEKAGVTARDFFGAEGSLHAEVTFDDSIAMAKIIPNGIDFGPGACQLITSMAWFSISEHQAESHTLDREPAYDAPNF
jgi:hypothetical protein